MAPQYRYRSFFEARRRIWLFLIVWITFVTLSFSQHFDIHNKARPAFFDDLQRLSRKAFDMHKEVNTSGLAKTKLKYPYEVVSLDAKAGSYGGLGNLLFGILGVEGLALATGKVSVVNHAVIQSMFLHPDSEYGQGYDLINTDEMKEITEKRPDDLFRGVHEMKPCREWYHIPNLAKMVFIHNCNGQAINHPYVQKVLAPIFHTEIDHRDYFRKVGSGILQWFSSNPTPAFRQFALEHRNIILKHCGRDINSTDPWETAIDLTIQIRNFKDLGVFEKMSCYQDCMMQAIEMAIKRRAKYVKSTSPICMYVTSDNETTTDNICDFLSKNTSLNLKVHADKSSQFHMEGPDWHTVGLLNDMRLHYNYHQLEQRYDLLDWMVLRDSLAAMYTQESTFSKTARMSAGYQQQRNDLKYGHSDNQCYCERGILEYDFDM